MTAIPDISTLTAADLVALKTAIDSRLEELRQRHVEEAQALGLTLVDGNTRARRKRRETEPADETD
jgi:hypothetical protein